MGKRESVSKANDYSMEALKQILTLSSGTLVLTVSFFKDILGESFSKSYFNIVVPVSWLCLAISIWVAWSALTDASVSLGIDQKEDYLFSEDHPTARFMAIAAQITFSLGISLLTLFCIVIFTKKYVP